MIRGAILDVDGTVVRGTEPIAGAPGAVERLLDRDTRLVFCSNNPTKGPAAYAEKLATANVPLPQTPPERFVVTAGTATAAYLRDHHAGDAVYVFGESGVRDQLASAPVTVTDDAHAADVVVVSIDYGFDYDSLSLAIRAIDADTTFLGTDPDPVIPGGDGPVPGSGAIVNAVEGVVGRQPDVIAGKPAEPARRLALDRLDESPASTLVVGDRLDTDIALGEAIGAHTALVCSGVTDRAAVADSPHDPDYVLDSIAEIGRVLDAEA